MKTVNAAVKTALRSNYNVEVRPELFVEWNMNRYYDTTVDNIPNEDENNFDSEIFPIESIVENDRPTKGIAKARIDEASVYDFDITTNANRYYIASADDKYKYWTSQQKTNGSGVFPTYNDGSTTQTTVRPHVIYEKDLMVNKIVVTVDNYWASPNQYFIQVKYSIGGEWTTVATSPAINNNGEITIYWNGSSWSSTKPSLIDPPLVSIRGVMIKVDSMTSGKTLSGAPTGVKTSNGTRYTPNGSNSFFNLIEISARREVDLTDRLITVNDTQDFGLVSELYPIGTITSNDGSITLSNLYSENGVQKTGLFSKHGSSTYKEIVKPNVKFNLNYIYKIGGTDYSVKQFEMYGGEWMGELSDEVQIPITDASKFLKEAYPSPFMVEGLSIVEIFQRVLDNVGFVKWRYPTDDTMTENVIPVFWVTGEENVWQILDDLALGTQSAIYFDEEGYLNIKTREMAFDDRQSSVWTIRSENSGTELPDLIDATQNEDLGANHITITYQTTKWDGFPNGTASFQKVWEPDSTTVLRSTQLVRDINPDSSFFWMSPADAKIWPYEGIVQIEGELIKYEGKTLVYYTGTSGNTKNTRVCNSAEEYLKYNRKTPREYRHKNGFDGSLFIPQLDGDRENARGYWNSEKRNHKVDMADWNVRYSNFSGNTAGASASSYGWAQRRSNSVARLISRTNATGHDINMATVGNSADSGFKYLGCRMRFLSENGLTNQRAGLAFNLSGNENGYYVELKTTGAVPTMTLYSQTSNVLKEIKSVEVPIINGLWYELDISVTGNGGQVIVWLDGLMRMSETISGGDIKALNGKFGAFVRGDSKVEYEYIYGIARDEATLKDDSTFFNLIEGGFTGGFWDREWVHGWKTRKIRRKKKSKKQSYRWNNYFFDDFGPYIHEVREFNVKFDPAPVQISRLYFTNEWQAICTEYRSTPFGAYFVMTNASRYNAVIHGDDNLTLGADRTISQVLTAIGRQLIFSDSETVEVKDADSIRERGKIESEISSPWIQNKQMAKSISEWMKKHWSKGLDQIDVTIFGNPLFQIGDVVSLDIPDRGILATTHKYYITSINTSFENGLSTELGLRRVI